MFCRTQTPSLRVYWFCSPPGSVQLRNMLIERFGVELPATAALDFPTVTALAEHITNYGLTPSMNFINTELQQQPSAQSQLTGHGLLLSLQSHD